MDRSTTVCQVYLVILLWSEHTYWNETFSLQKSKIQTSIFSCAKNKADLLTDISKSKVTLIAVVVFEKKKNISKCFLILGKGSMGMSGDGMMSPDGKPKADIKDDSGPANEPHKPKVPS